MSSSRPPHPIPLHSVFLVGFMGSGKSTVGRLLAQRMAWKFVDLDQLIEEAEGTTITEIFARAGEAAFRRREQELLRRIVQESPSSGGRVVALGGGTIAQTPNRELLQQSQAITIWLKCPIEQLLMRVALMQNRPLFRDEASFRKLYEERLPFYQQATFSVDCGPGDPGEVVQQILALPIFQGMLCVTEDET